ncbi:Oidioi.mRNA.OKI2018_I69.chr1.g3726.t1.cds [Oikopleura dioica]|uniref:Oidioi.mRNA.OKI2018_I69.chr1.g3726.t1.cds n=1 Tax=Oikopleura dioica TaxID=34765 RepID=A0ABN7SV40_OIKDI|nr:Oidioi.mRNA.OKI2018_I69.chr1.g3726.t1.cds [Oikopleura dioica]
MFTPKGSSSKRSRLRLGNSPRASPSASRLGGGSSVPVHIAELLKDQSVSSAAILNDGWACVAAGESLHCWKMNQKTTSFRVQTPVNSNVSAKNFAIVEQSACFISISGSGRFWPKYSDETRWIDFRVPVEAGEIVQQLHSSKNRIVAVTSKAGLVGLSISNSSVSARIHRNQKQTGFLSRTISSLWASSETFEHPPLSTMVDELVLIFQKDEIQLWDVLGDQAQLRTSMEKEHVIDDDSDSLLSIYGNSKYIGFLSSFGEKMKLKIISLSEMLNESYEFDSKIISLPQNHQASVILPYMTESAVVSASRLWLGEDCDVEKLDEILSVGAFDGKVVVLTKRGLVMKNTMQKLNTETLSETMIGRSKSYTEEISSMGSIESMEQMAGSDNPKLRLQAAILQFARGNKNEAKGLLATVGDVNSTAIQLSHDFINEIPTHDPRWSETGRAAAAPQAGKPLLIQKQLAEKIATHGVFRSFVASSVDGEALGIIAQDAEKLAVAAALRSSPANLQTVIGHAIQSVLTTIGSRVPQRLTPQDVFYAKVTEVGDIVNALSEFCENIVNQTQQRTPTVQELDLIHHSNQTICSILGAITSFRQDNADLYQETSRLWTQLWLKTLLSTINVSCMKKFEQQRATVIEQLFIMSKFLLSDRLVHVKAGNSNSESQKEFVSIREKCVAIFTERKRWNEAGLLAEQFQDFGGLLEVYQATKNEKDFARYLLIPEFPEFIKSKFVGKELVDIAVQFGGRIAELVREDSDHGWMLMIRENNFDQAGERLVEQAKDDSNAYGRRTLISLAKLASIAGGAPPPDETQAIKEEKLLDFQDTIPDPQLRVSNTSSALDVYDIIDALTNQNIRQITIDDVENAMQVYDLAEPRERNELNTLIWARLISSEIEHPSWKRALENAHQPLEAIEDTLVDQLLRFCTNSEQLPIANEVISHPELCNYADQPVLSYILSAAIEFHAERLDGMES